MNAVLATFRRHPLLWSFIAVVVVLNGVIFVTIPAYGDDWSFLGNIRDAGTSPDGTFDWWKGVTGCWQFRFATDNARLANVFVAPLLLLPRWVAALLNTAAMAMFFVVTARLLSHRDVNVPAMVTFVALYMLVLPWPDHFYTPVFAFNYVWGVLWMALAVWLFLRRRDTPRPWAFVAGLICGAWHEGFGLSALAGLGTAFVFYRPLRRHANVALLAGLLSGMLWLFSMRGMYARIEDSVEQTDISMLRFAWPVIMFVVLWLAGLAIRRLRPLLLRDIVVVCVVGAVAETGVACIVHLSRACVPGVMMSITGICYMLTAVRPLRWVKAVVAVLALLIVAHLSAAVYYTAKIAGEADEILRAYLSPDCVDGVVFHDVTNVEDTHWLAFRKPTPSEYIIEWTPMAIAAYYHRPMLKVIPAALRHYRGGQGRPLSADGSIRLYRGHVVCGARPGLETGEHGLKADLGAGPATYSGVAKEFTASDGNRYVYIYIVRPLVDTWRGSPVAVELF